MHGYSNVSPVSVITLFNKFKCKRFGLYMIFSDMALVDNYFCRCAYSLFAPHVR